MGESQSNLDPFGFGLDQPLYVRLGFCSYFPGLERISFVPVFCQYGIGRTTKDVKIDIVRVFLFNTDSRQECHYWHLSWLVLVLHCSHHRNNKRYSWRPGFFDHIIHNMCRPWHHQNHWLEAGCIGIPEPHPCRWFGCRLRCSFGRRLHGAKK